MKDKLSHLFPFKTNIKLISKTMQFFFNSTLLYSSCAMKLDADTFTSNIAVLSHKFQVVTAQ